MLTTKIFSTASAVLIALSFSSAHAAGRKSDEAKVTLQDMEMYAVDAADRASDLVQISLSSQLSRDSHSWRLMAIKDDINKMGREIESLEAEHDSLPKWEQQASDKALPLLKDAAASTQSAIEFMTENPEQVWTLSYRGYADTIFRDSDQIAKTLRDYLKYAKAQQVEQNLALGGN